MRHAVVLAGGSGTRLWPLSTRDVPKQLIPFEGGKSLLSISLERVEPLVGAERLYVCAAEEHRALVERSIPSLDTAHYLGEPSGRDTLAAIGFACAVIAREDPAAVLGVFTSDHMIRPVDRFRATAESGYSMAESRPEAIVTFGVEPTHGSTAYGYLELGEVVGGARRVTRFREKPDAPTADAYVKAGPERYLWNSGMFLFRAATLLDLLGRYEPDLRAALGRIAAAWDTPERAEVLRAVYPDLRRSSIDYAVMERASTDPSVRVLAIPLGAQWMDVGSWPTYGAALGPDDRGNAVVGRGLLLDTTGSVVVCDDPEHLVATLGCEDLVVVHTARATLVCPKSRADEIKRLHAEVAERHGERYL
jgi:mannose-1-phosphate guanylyltransferase